MRYAAARHRVRCSCLVSLRPARFVVAALGRSGRFLGASGHGVRCSCFLSLRPSRLVVVAFCRSGRSRSVDALASRTAAVRCSCARRSGRFRLVVPCGSGRSTLAWFVAAHCCSGQPQVAVAGSARPGRSMTLGPFPLEACVAACRSARVGVPISSRDSDRSLPQASGRSAGRAGPPVRVGTGAVNPSTVGRDPRTRSAFTPYR